MLITGKPVPGVPTAHRRPSETSASVSATAKWQDNRVLLSRRKCPRRSRIASRSSCGFGMPGTDHPTLDLTKFRSKPVDEDVGETLRWRLASEIAPVQHGEVFFGASSTYRAVRDHNGEAMLIKLSPFEVAAVRVFQRNRDMAAVYERVSRRIVAENPAAFVGKSPSVSLPRVLTATREWESLYSCDTRTGKGLSDQERTSPAASTAPSGARPR